MWKILFYIVVLVAVAKASPQSSDDLTLEDITKVNVFNKIGMLVSKYKSELNNLRETVSGKLLQVSKFLNVYNPKSCVPCSCGVLGSNLKIVGGEEVKYPHKYPWMALILRDGKFNCGGSLINDKYVLTAGHCVEILKASNYKVRLSVHDRNADISEEYNVKKIIKHANYVNYGGLIFNDIALIRLDTDGVKINREVLPVCMPEKGLSYANVVGVAPGWGLTDASNIRYPVVLREAELYLLDNSECGPYYFNIITPDMVCAGMRDEGKSTCNGDSGGPLTVSNGSVHHLVGITSFGKTGCRSPPAVYTRVSQYLDWIKANTEDACPCHDNYAE